VAAAAAIIIQSGNSLSPGAESDAVGVVCLNPPPVVVAGTAVVVGTPVVVAVVVGTPVVVVVVVVVDVETEGMPVVVVVVVVETIAAMSQFGPCLVTQLNVSTKESTRKLNNNPTPKICVPAGVALAVVVSRIVGPYVSRSSAI
jgi:hypothetical protein